MKGLTHCVNGFHDEAWQVEEKSGALKDSKCGAKLLGL